MYTNSEKINSDHKHIYILVRSSDGRRTEYDMGIREDIYQDLTTSEEDFGSTIAKDDEILLVTIGTSVVYSALGSKTKLSIDDLIAFFA